MRYISKITGALLVCLLWLQYASAQKLSKSQIKDFKSIVLSPNNPLDRTLVLKKWSGPIYYKVYGTEDARYDAAVKRETNIVFAQLRKLTGLQIRKVNADDSVNYTVIIGSPNKFADLIGPDALFYFKSKRGTQTFFNTSDEGITSMILVVDPEQYRELPMLNTIIQIQIVWGMGFFGKIDFTGNSLFSVQPNILSIQFKHEDEQRIKLMYSPLIKHGMKEKDLDAVLKAVE